MKLVIKTLPKKEHLKPTLELFMEARKISNVTCATKFSANQETSIHISELYINVKSVSAVSISADFDVVRFTFRDKICLNNAIEKNFLCE